MRDKYINELWKAIRKIKGIELLEDSIRWIIQDIEKYLAQEQEYQGITAQSVIGIYQLFRGWIT